MSRLPTLGDVLRDGDRLTAHCENYAWGPRGCSHSTDLDVAALVEKYGPDCEVIALNGRFRCAVCGAKGGIVHLTPGPGTKGMGDGSTAYQGIVMGKLAPGERARLIIKKRRRRKGPQG